MDSSGPQLKRRKPITYTCGCECEECACRTDEKKSLLQKEPFEEHHWNCNCSCCTQMSPLKDKMVMEMEELQNPTESDDEGAIILNLYGLSCR